MSKVVQGLEDYSYDDIIEIINDFVIDRIWDSGYSSDDIKLTDIRLHGSRLRGQARDDSDLDAVVEYDGEIREDDFFSILNDEDPLYIDNVKVDINPIKEDMPSYIKRSNKYDLDKINRKESKMRRAYKPTLEERIARLERAVDRRKPTNEVAPIIAKAAPIILKNLPLILSVLPDFIKALDGDTMNDNSDKIEILTQFGELGQKVGEMFKDIKV